MGEESQAKGKAVKRRTEMRSFGVSSRIGHQSAGFYSRRLYEGAAGQQSEQVSAKALDESEAGQPANSGQAGQPAAQALNRIHCRSSERMEELPDGCVHLMVTSPPYNVGKDYDDNLSLDEYLGLLGRVFAETYRVLAPGGRACVNVANLGRKPYIPLNALIATEMQRLGYLMRGEIIWNKEASAGASCAWGSWRSPSNPVLRDTHEYILVFCKEDYARKGAAGEATIGKEDFLAATKSVWEFPAESARRVNHPAPFPVELPKRLIELYTYSDDLVLDPFMGSGSTAIAAKTTGRRWIGYDTSKEYTRAATARIEALLT